MSKLQQEQFGLIEKNTYIIVATTPNLSAANFIIEKSLGLFFLIPWINLKEGFDLITTDYWNYCFDLQSRKIHKHNFSKDSINDVYYSLIKNKLKSLEEIARTSQFLKNRYKGTNNDFTDLILLTREQQAKNFLNGKDDDLCYVVEYAKGNAMDLKEAAEDIVVRSSLMHNDLAKIEGMKYLYFNKINKCQNEVELRDTINLFNREAWFSN